MKKIIILVLISVFIVFYLGSAHYFRNCNISLGFKEGVLIEEAERSLRFYKKIKDIRIDINTKYQMASIYLPSRFLFPLVYYSLKFQNIFDKNLNKVSYSRFIDMPGPSR